MPASAGEPNGRKGAASDLVDADRPGRRDHGRERWAGGTSRPLAHRMGDRRGRRRLRFDRRLAGLSNRIGLNADFLPAVSLGDVGSFVAGAIAPTVTLPFVGGNRSREWLPAVVGGIVGFVANVVTL